MHQVTKLSNEKVTHLAEQVWEEIKHLEPHTRRIYGIPRGGIPVAYAVAAASRGLLTVVDLPEEADAFVDDIIDSGATLKKYATEYPGIPLYALINKQSEFGENLGWVEFPWEGSPEAGIEDNILRLLEFVGEDPNREGLLETPKRVAKAWSFWCSGYGQDPKDVMKVFEDGAKGCDEMVIVRDIPIYSHCEHHMAMIVGTVTIAYIPNGKIVGLSKLARLADIFARRLQVQERLTNQIADALQEHLNPLGIGVLIKARHMCMESRGVCKQGQETITSALRGSLRNDTSARAEFMVLVK